MRRSLAGSRVWRPPRVRPRSAGMDRRRPDLVPAQTAVAGWPHPPGARTGRSVHSALACCAGGPSGSGSSRALEPGIGDHLELGRRPLPRAARRAPHHRVLVLLGDVADVQRSATTATRSCSCSCSSCSWPTWPTCSAASSGTTTRGAGSSRGAGDVIDAHRGHQRDGDPLGERIEVERPATSVMATDIAGRDRRPSPPSRAGGDRQLGGELKPRAGDDGPATRPRAPRSGAALGAKPSHRPRSGASRAPLRARQRRDPLRPAAVPLHLAAFRCAPLRSMRHRLT